MWKTKFLTIFDVNYLVLIIDSLTEFVRASLFFNNINKKVYLNRLL